MAKTETLSPAPVIRSWLPPLNGGTALMAGLIGIMGFIVVYPLILILINSFNTATIAEPPVYGLKAWRDAFSEYGIWRSLWNSVKIGIVLQIIALPLGIFVSWLLARTNILFANHFEFGFWISFFLPNLATTFGWMLMLDPSTGPDQRLAAPASFFERAQFRHLFLLGDHLGAFGFHRLVDQGNAHDTGVSAHGCVDGRGEPDVRRERIYFPVADSRCRPCTGGGRFVFPCSASFQSSAALRMETLLGVPWSFYVYSTKIVDLARQEPPLVNQAAALGSIILVFLAAFIPIQRKLITRRQFTTVTGQFKPKTIDLGAWRYPATAFVALVIFILDVVPLLSVLGGSFMTRFGFFNLPKTWTLEYWKMSLSDPRILQGLHNTLIVAVSAGLVGAVLFSLIGYVLVRTKLPGRAVLDSICWLPSAIPGVLSGLGLLWMFLGTRSFARSTAPSCFS